MSSSRLTPLIFSTAVAVNAQVASEPVELPPVTVYSPMVANQEPVGTFAMPVSALTYEPLVDVQARNLAEGQADVSIRGGTFENTGFSIGATPIYDPQTGHYSAELPVAPAMLGAPTVRTGAENTFAGWNATAGGVNYAWQPIRSGGFVSGAAGDNSLVRGEAYSGYAKENAFAGRTFAADVNVGYSDGNSSREFGYHNFERQNVRLQLRDETAQTDLFAGYQSKKFGWPNMYAASSAATPLRAEREDIQTSLFAVNHRVRFGADGDYIQAGAYYRDNDDHYSIPIFPFDAYHTTIVRGTGLDGRSSLTDSTALRYRAGVIGDDLDSTSLTFGTFESRTQVYAGLFADHVIVLDGQSELTLTAGANYDDSNRDPSAVSPVAQVSFAQSAGGVRRAYVSYAESTQLPNYTALNANPLGGLFRGDPDLGRSNARNYEIGADFAPVAGWATRAAIFYRQDRDLLDWVFTPPVTARFAVQGDIDTFGFEAVSRRSWERLDVVFGYTFLDKDEDYLAPGESSFYAVNYAEHRLTAAIVARLGGGFEVRMDNEARIQAESALRRRNDEVVLSSLGVYYTVPGVKGLSLNAQVDNLWNTYFEEVPLVPGARRQFSAGARYAW